MTSKTDVVITPPEVREFYPGWRQLRPLRSRERSVAFPSLFVAADISWYEDEHDVQRYLRDRQYRHPSEGKAKIAALTYWRDDEAEALIVETVLMWGGTAYVESHSFDLDNEAVMMAAVEDRTRLAQEFLSMPRRRRIDEDEEGVVWRYADPPPQLRRVPEPIERLHQPLRIFTFYPRWRSLNHGRFRRPARAFPGLYINPDDTDIEHAAAEVPKVAAVATVNDAIEVVLMFFGSVYVRRVPYSAEQLEWWCRIGLEFAATPASRKRDVDENGRVYRYEDNDTPTSAVSGRTTAGDRYIRDTMQQSPDKLPPYKWDPNDRIE